MSKRFYSFPLVVTKIPDCKNVGHTCYMINNIKIVSSVTNLVEYFFGGRILKNTMLVKKKKTLKSPDYRARGTKFHYLVHRFFIADQIIISKNTIVDKCFVQFLNFSKKMKQDGFVNIGSEIRIYSKLGLSGKIDAIFVKNKRYYLYDWKMSNHSLGNKIPNRYAGKPFNDMIDFDLNKYVLTLNIYRLMLKEFNIKVEKMFIVNFIYNENNSYDYSYQIHEINTIEDNKMRQAIEYFNQRPPSGTPSDISTMSSGCGSGSGSVSVS